MKTVDKIWGSQVIEHASKVFNALVTLKHVANNVKGVYDHYKYAVGHAAIHWGMDPSSLSEEVSHTTSKKYTDCEWSFEDLEQACNLLQNCDVLDGEIARHILEKAYSAIACTISPSNKKEFAKQHPLELLTLVLLLHMTEEDILSLDQVKHIVEAVATNFYFNSEDLWEMVIKVYSEFSAKEGED